MKYYAVMPTGVMHELEDACSEREAMEAARELAGSVSDRFSLTVFRCEQVGTVTGTLGGATGRGLDRERSTHTE